MHRLDEDDRCTLSPYLVAVVYALDDSVLANIVEEVRARLFSVCTLNAMVRTRSRNILNKTIFLQD